jgi:homocysteine S-methyltransferase
MEISMNIREYLTEHTLLFDGSMGVYYRAQYPDGSRCEEANLSHPERVAQIHRAYLAAGAKAIKTNTFAANTQSLGVSFSQVAENIRAAWRLAREAVQGTEAFVFADIGPLPGLEPEEEEYEKIVDVFLSLGAKHFLFETFDRCDVQPALAQRIKEQEPEAFVLVSFGVLAEGFSSAGLSVDTLFRQAQRCSAIDGVGLNCVSGPGHLLKLVAGLKERPKLLSVMPNAGYPTLVRGEAVYGGKPDYFAARMAELHALGVPILGGCCGTTPEFIRKTAAALGGNQTPSVEVGEPVKPPRPRPVNRLSEKLDQGQRVIALELDPPADDNIEQFLDGARRLRDAGVDAITIADCPIARARADSSMLAAKLHRELGLDPIPHMTCRDRNINATRALLLGLSIEAVHNVLLVTGDPIPSSQREEIKGVFSFNSAVLASYIRALGEAGTVAPFRIYGALNVNAVNFPAELRKAQRKEEGGVNGFLTQPVFTQRAYENLQLAHDTLHSPILGGIYPLVSQRNAQFMNSEVSGIEIGQEIIDRYAGLDRQQGEDLAVELSVEAARRMMPMTAGWYLMTPFSRIGLMERILAGINQLKEQ